MPYEPAQTVPIVRGLYSTASLNLYRFRYTPRPNNSNVWQFPIPNPIPPNLWNLNFQQFNVTIDQLITSGVQFPVIVLVC